jgi:hypothetical protein
MPLENSGCHLHIVKEYKNLTFDEYVIFVFFYRNFTEYLGLGFCKSLYYIRKSFSLTGHTDFCSINN